MKLVLADTASGYDLSPINNNFNLLEQELQNRILYRDNPDGEPNQMENDLDMNSNSILNAVTDVTNPNSLLTVQDGDQRYLNTDGDSLTGDINAGGFKITNLGAPTSPNAAARLSDVGPDSAASLRIELSSEDSGEGASLVSMEGGPTVETAINNRVIRVGSVAEDFSGRNVVEGYQFNVTGWHPDTESGGGNFVARAAVQKSAHNGGTIISPTVPPVSEQSGTTLSERVENFLSGAGETDPSGTGCFLRIDNPGYLLVDWFGAKKQSDFNSKPCFLRAFQAAGENGRLIKLAAGDYYFSETLFINTDTLGFVWRNIYLSGEASSSPYQGNGGYQNTAIRTDGFSAIKIELQAYGHEHIEFENIAFLNESGASKVGVEAITIEIDGNRDFNYPNGWYFDRVSCENYQSLIGIDAINISNTDERFVGKFCMNRIHTWQTEYALYNRGGFLNLFSAKDWRAHSSGKVRMNSNSGIFGFFSNCHWEGARPCVFEISSSAFGCSFSLHNYDGEQNGDASSGTPYTNGFVQFIGGGTPINLHSFVFTGFVRMPSFNEQSIELPQIKLSCYTDNQISIIPKGTIIETPEKVRVVEPVNNLEAFRFMIPLRCLKGIKGAKKVSALGHGVRPTFSPGIELESVQEYPKISAIGSVFDNLFVQDNPDAKNIFAVSWVMDFVETSTRMGNPITSKISGSTNTYFLSSELVNEPCLAVFGFKLDPSTQTVEELRIVPVNPGGDYIKSPGVSSWYDSGQSCVDYVFKDGIESYGTLQVADSATETVRIQGKSDAATPEYGLSLKVKVSVDNGKLGSAEYLFKVNAGGRSNTELNKYQASGITISPAYAGTFDIAGISINNTTGASVSAAVSLEWV